MTAPALELQGLIISTLKASAAVTALVDGIYDQPPASPWGGANQAYISLGPTDINIDDADCISGETHSIQLDIWSRKVGQVACKQICAAVKSALHLQPLSLTDNALVEIRLDLYRILKDPDGLTTHGALQFSCMIEDDSGVASL